MTDKLDRVVAYINSYTDPVAPTETVTVPRELLREVLDEAAADAQTVEHEFGTHAKDQASYDEHRARINELRRIAGLDE